MDSEQRQQKLEKDLEQAHSAKAQLGSEFSKLQIANSALAADSEELKATQAQAAELKNTLSAQRDMLTQSEQRQQELKKDLEQTQNAKAQIDRELSEQSVLVADLQKKLETSRGEQVFAGRAAAKKPAGNGTGPDTIKATQHPKNFI